MIALNCSFQWLQKSPLLEEVMTLTIVNFSVKICTANSDQPLKHTCPDQELTAVPIDHA